MILLLDTITLVQDTLVAVKPVLSDTNVVVDSMVQRKQGLTSKFSDVELSDTLALISIIVTILVFIISYRNQKKKGRITLEKEEAGKRNAIKPVFRIARQEPSVEELNFYDEHEKNPKSIDSIKYEGLVKNKYVDVVLENITKQRPFGIKIEISNELPFTPKPLSGATKRDLINNLIINTVIDDEFIVRDNIDNFKLLLRFSDIENNEYQQVITCKNYKLAITEPRLLKNNR